MALQSGELLQSYFLRKKMAYDGNISLTGLALSVERQHFSWKNYSPLFLPDVLDKTVEKTALIADKILRKHTLASLYIPTLTEELYVRMIDGYLTRVEERTEHVSKAINNLLPRNYSLKFCSDCFCEQIEEVGFHWFKVEWSLPKATDCFIHKKKLKTLRCRNCGYMHHKPADMLRSLIKGMCFFCRSSMFKNDSFEDCEVAGRLWEPENICDRKLLGKRYAVFSTDLQRIIIKHTLTVAADTMIYKASQRPLNQLIFSAIEQQKVNRFLKGEVDSVPKHLFWQCVTGAFKNLTKFDRYLNGHALIHTVMAKDIVADTRHNFKVRLYIPNT